MGALLLAACGDDDQASTDTAATDTAPADTTATDTTPADTTPADTTATDGTPADTSEGGDADAGLDGREFVSTGVEGYELAPDSVIRISFMGDEIGISAGCNTMGGAYDLTDGVLVADQLFMTQMACDEPLMQQDAWMAEFLAAGAEVSLDGDTLILTGDSATITLVDREVAEPDLPLEGTEWRVDGLVRNDAVSSAFAGSEPTFVVDGDTVSIDTGCNSGSGAVEVDEAAGTITFGPIAVTEMGCEPDLLDQEAAILQVLDGEVTYEIESNALVLTNVADPTLGLTLTADR